MDNYRTEAGEGQRPQTVSQSPEGVQKARQAKELLRQGRWPAALALYRGLIAEFPWDRDLRRHVLLSAFKLKDYKEVLQQTLDLAELAFAEGDSHGGIERCAEALRLPELVAGEQGQEAAEEVRALVEPWKSEIYLRYGEHYLDAGQPDLALQYFDVSERLAPGRWETSWGRGQAFLLRGQKREAVRALYQSIQTAPNDAAEAYESLGAVLLGEGRELKDLRKYFARASVIYESHERYEDALSVCFRWLELDSQDREMADRARALTQRIHSP